MGVQTAWAILPVAFAGYLVGGLGHGVKNVLLRALLTARVPEAVHGRAFAAYNAARNTAELGAVGAGGVLVSALGPRAALLLAGLGPILAAVGGADRAAAARGGRPAGGRGSAPDAQLARSASSCRSSFACPAPKTWACRTRALAVGHSVSRSLSGTRRSASPRMPRMRRSGCGGRAVDRFFDDWLLNALIPPRRWPA